MAYEGIRLTPIGIVRNRSEKAAWQEKGWLDRAARMKAQRDSLSDIVIDGVPEEALEGIEDYSHITVIYWAHLIDDRRRAATMKVHPIGNPDFPEVGVFATQSPVRPNPILCTPVRLLERKGNRLKVTGLDALDGSPVLDIKPYVSSQGELKNAMTPAWMQRINREFDEAGGQE